VIVNCPQVMQPRTEAGRDEDSRNGGAAACAAAKEGSGKQRLPVVAAFCGRRVRSGGADSSSEESEGAGLDGGAAACTAAMDDEMLSEVLLEAGVCWFECCAEDVRGWMESEAVTAAARGHWELAQQNVWDRVRQLQQGAECSDTVVRAPWRRPRGSGRRRSEGRSGVLESGERSRFDEDALERT
jgi:hypothetical protein